MLEVKDEVSQEETSEGITVSEVDSMSVVESRSGDERAEVKLSKPDPPEDTVAMLLDVGLKVTDDE